MLGTAASSITISAGMPGRMEAVKSGAWIFLQVEIDHHVLGDLATLGGSVLQAIKAILHLGNATLEPGGQGLIGQGGPDNGGKDFM